MCVCKHFSHIIEHIEVADEFITSKNAIFMIKPRHPGRLKEADLSPVWKKPAVGALVTCEKTPATVTWSERLKIYYRIIVKQ